MLGSPCSPCCSVPELLGWDGTNSAFLFSSVRTARGAVFGFDMCGTKSLVTSLSGTGVDVIDCSEGNASYCPADFTNSLTGSVRLECLLRIPVGSTVTLTLSGALPYGAYVFAGLRSIGEQDARSLASSVQLERRFNPDVLWDPMPNVFGYAGFSDIYFWSLSQLSSWPCGSLNTVVPLYTLDRTTPQSFSGTAVQSMPDERQFTTFTGAVICGHALGARTCSPSSTLSRATQHTAADEFCKLDMFLRRNGNSAPKSSFTVTLSW